MLKYWSFIFDYLRIWVRSSPEQMHFLPQSIKLVCFQRLITVLTAVLLPSTFIFGWQKLQMFAKIFANSDKVRSETGGNYVQIWICKHLIRSDLVSGGKLLILFISHIPGSSVSDEAQMMMTCNYSPNNISHSISWCNTNDSTPQQQLLLCDIAFSFNGVVPSNKKLKTFL